MSEQVKCAVCGWGMVEGTESGAICQGCAKAQGRVPVGEAQGESPSEWRRVASMPIPMLLSCPVCGWRHIDVEFADKPHHTHACQHCGHCWRPAVVPTVGVMFLPGFKDQPAGSTAAIERPHAANRVIETQRRYIGALIDRIPLADKLPESLLRQAIEGAIAKSIISYDLKDWIDKDVLEAFTQHATNNALTPILLHLATHTHDEGNVEPEAVEPDQGFTP